MSRQREPLDWGNINRVKFCCLCPTLLLGTKALFYPPDLIKTRLQVQTPSPPYNFNYKGPRHAFKSILRREGIRGLYKGFGVSNLGVLVMQVYIVAFEATKVQFGARLGPHRMKDETTALFVSSTSGVVAAVVAQLLGTPCRVLLQNIQCEAKVLPKAVGAAATPPLRLRQAKKPGRGGNNKWGQLGRGPSFTRTPSTLLLAQSLVRAHGLGHLWKGFSGSVLMYAPTSAIWWMLYPVFHRRAESLLRTFDLDVNGKVRGVLTKAAAGSMAAGVTCLATNPLDVVRTRHNLLSNVSSSVDTASSQSSAGPRAWHVLRDLVRAEGLAGLYRGFSVRAAKFCLSSFVMVVIYEGVKEECRLR
eukprot:INCI14278.2.p1 GENE.INCI14278.2~~INCI14278.2.p1  ORF type:complete len:360 (-),score=42.06 INCI14278.2:597-1676(-)